MVRLEFPSNRLVSSGSTFGLGQPYGVASATVGGALPIYYLRNTGAGAEDGSDWDNCFGSFADAVAGVSAGARVRCFPEEYSITSPVVINNKDILWDAPPRIAGQLTGVTGNLHITGSGTRPFDITGTSDGGGFRNFTFDLDAFSGGQFVRMAGAQNFLMEGCYSKGSDNDVEKVRRFLSVIGSANVDGLIFRDNDTHSGYLLDASGLDAAVSANDWLLENNDCQKAQPDGFGSGWFSEPQIRLTGGADFDGVEIVGGYLETTESPTIQINMTGVAGSRRVYVGPIGWERCRSTSADFTACDVEYVSHYGGRFTHNGVFWGASTVDGFVACPPYRLSGDLSPGGN